MLGGPSHLGARSVLGLRDIIMLASVFCSVQVTPAKSQSTSERCIFELSPPEEPYYLLGSLVRPQSNYLAVADCDKTLDEVKEDIAQRAQARARSRAALRVFRGTEGSSSLNGSTRFANCTAARASGYGPIVRGSPGYAAHLDRDNDGIACE